MFYGVSQNNSGGYFIENEDVAEYLIIEAMDIYQANHILYDIVEDYSEYCTCCGERWCEIYDEGQETPSLYGQPVMEFLKSSDKYYRNRSVIIYYLDGHKQFINPK